MVLAVWEMIWSRRALDWRDADCRSARSCTIYHCLAWRSFASPGRWRALAVEECIFALKVRPLGRVTFLVPGTQIGADKVTLAAGKVAAVDLLWCV